MTEAFNLTNHFLIAMPTLEDPNFFHSVTLICEHNEEGTMGILINRPLEIRLSEILEQMGIENNSEDINQQCLFLGGPVQNERGFILHKPHGDGEEMLVVSDNLALSSSRDMLASIAANEGPEKSLIALGYAGWAAGQLEKELAENAWISTPASEQIIFDTPVTERWKSAAASAGIDLSRLSSDVGHA